MTLCLGGNDFKYMVVGICKLALFLPECQSLKEKRSVLRRIKDRFFAHFKIMLAEVDDLNLWQKAGMGFALVGNDRRVIESLMEKGMNFVDAVGGAHVIDRTTEIINY